MPHIWIDKGIPVKRRENNRLDRKHYFSQWWRGQLRRCQGKSQNPISLKLWKIEITSIFYSSSVKISHFLMEGREYVIYLYTNKAIFPRVSSCKRSTSPHSAQWNQSKSAERQLWEQYRTYAKYEHSVKKKYTFFEMLAQ